jgi:hypothetical protein
MEPGREKKFRLRQKARFLSGMGVVLAVLLLANSPAQSYNFDTGNPDLTVTWDNTAEFSTSYRLRNPDNKLLSSINQRSGDLAFDSGFDSARGSLLSELTIQCKNYGIHTSADAWYDPFYWRGTNSEGTPFSYQAQRLLGLNAELLDAFGYGRADFGSSQLSFRCGQFAQIWGESLFFGNNGIANGMAPIDVTKALGVANAQFKEIIRPIPQIGGQLQLGPNLAIGAYYQLGWGWEPTRLPPVDSYYGFLNILGPGGQPLIVGPPLFPGAGPQAFFPAQALVAKDEGQGGIDVRFRFGEYDLGLYALRYNEHTPQIYLYPGVGVNPPTGRIGQYALVYPEGIQAYGASASKTYGICNLAGEMSFRHNNPLASDAITVLPGQQANNSDHALYAIGDSIHANISTLTSFGPTFIAKEATLLGEIAWNERVDITANPRALDPNTTRDAMGFRFVYEPVYRQVCSGLDLSFPVGISYYPVGSSSVITNFGPNQGGDFNIGIKATYLDTWRFGLTYDMFYGHTGTFLNGQNQFSFAQYYADRDYVSFYITRTF